MTAETFTLELHRCAWKTVSRPTYLATFESPAALKAWITAHGMTHAIHPLEDEDYSAEVLEILDPTCEHGLSSSLCAGPGHYPADL